MNVITATNLKALMPSALWTQKLRASLADFATPGDPLTTGLLAENWQGPETAHPIYSVGLQSIMNPNVLASVNQPICWRFMTGGSDPAEKASSGCWATPEATDVLASTALLNKLSIVADQPGNQFEIRVLRIPGLVVEAFWLKYTGLEAGSADWIVPYGLVQGGANLIKLPGGGTLNKNQAYTASDFLKIAADAAHKRLEADKNAPPNAV
jgi:hypothetical protein